MLINDRTDLEKDRLPEGQMMGGGTRRATQPLILENDCPMVTYTITVICFPYHLYSYRALIDEASCHNATAINSLAGWQVVIFLMQFYN